MSNYQTIGEMLFKCQTLGKTLLENILIISILTDFVIFSKLNLSDGRHLVRERCLWRLPLSGPLVLIVIYYRFCTDHSNATTKPRINFSLIYQILVEYNITIIARTQVSLRNQIHLASYPF